MMSCGHEALSSGVAGNEPPSWLVRSLGLVLDLVLDFGCWILVLDFRGLKCSVQAH
jgi:hypothetical protein